MEGNVSMNRIMCPACRQWMRYADEHAGKKTKCKKCGCILRLPVPSSEAKREDSPLDNPPGSPPLDPNQLTWVHGKSSRTVRLWCDGERSLEIPRRDGSAAIPFSPSEFDNMQRMIRGQSTLHTYRSSDLTIHYPPTAGRHALTVTCPRCGKPAKVMVKVFDEATRKQETKSFFIPLLGFFVLLYWAFVWYIGFGSSTQEGDWVSRAIGIFIVTLAGIALHGLLFFAIRSLYRPDPGLSGRIANLLPDDEHDKENGGNIGWHSLSCVKGDTPDGLSWDEVSDWERGESDTTPDHASTPIRPETTPPLGLWPTVFALIALPFYLAAVLMPLLAPWWVPHLLGEWYLEQQNLLQTVILIAGMIVSLFLCGALGTAFALVGEKLEKSANRKSSTAVTTRSGENVATPRE